MSTTDVTTIDVVKAKEELHRLIDQLPAWETMDALEHVRYLLSDKDTLSQEELEEVRRGEEEIARGEYVTLEEIKARLAR